MKWSTPSTVIVLAALSPGIGGAAGVDVVEVVGDIALGAGSEVIMVAPTRKQIVKAPSPSCTKSNLACQSRTI